MMGKTEVCPAAKTRADHGGVLLNELGQPVSERIGQVLQRLAPAFSRQFRDFRDESLLVEALERAAYRIRRREARDGAVANLEAYAWVTLVSIANSLLRRGRSRLAKKTVSGVAQSVLNLATSTFGTAEQIERAILIRELLDRLSPVEREVCEARLEGLSSFEIAVRRGCRPAAVDALLMRVRRKLRLLVNHDQSPTPIVTNPSVSHARRHRPRHRRRHVSTGVLQQSRTAERAPELRKI